MACTPTRHIVRSDPAYPAEHITRTNFKNAPKEVGIMLHLARFSTRRPFLAFAVWFAVAAALAAIGLGISHSLSPTIVVVPGSETSRAEHLAQSNFGPSVLVPVLLEGPKAQLDRQGPVLVKALSARRDTRVLSAWDAGSAGESLRPDATHAMIVASVAQTEKARVDGIQKDIDRTIDQKISSPVASYVSGTPTIDLATKDQSLDTARRAELIALPILFVVLLVILRAPIAALVLTAFGGATSLVSFGAMALLGKAIEVDPTAVTLASMAGLMLGVAYAMLVYRRWRAERSALHAHDRAGEALAASRAVETSGRAVLIGGTALVVSQALAPLIAPDTILISLGIGTTLCAALAIGGAVVVLPAVLTILGGRMEAFSFGVPAFLMAPWNLIAGRGGGWVLRNAVGAGAVATALLAVLAVPMLSLETGPISPELLPKNDPAHVAYDKIGAVMGPGFTSAFNIVVVSKDKPITDRAMLRKLDAFQAKIAKDKRVSSVVGPGDLYATAGELRALPKQLHGSKKMLKTAPAGLKKLEEGLGTAGAGSAQIQSGLAAAAAGAGDASAGSAKLHSYLGAAQAGSAKVAGGLDVALAGAQQLQSGAGQLLAGANKLSSNLGLASSKVNPEAVKLASTMAANTAAANKTVQGAKSSADQITSQLDAVLAQLKSSSDPNAAALARTVGSARSSAAGISQSLAATSQGLGQATLVSAGLAQQLPELSNGLARLYAGSSDLAAGIARLKSGNATLSAGLGKLQAGGGTLSSGLADLTTGAGQLESGLNQLASGLSSAPGKVDPLIGGLGQMQVAVAKFRGQLPSAKDLERLQASSPGLFNSGYFVLAAVAGAPAQSRNQAASVVNLKGGGTAGQIMVVPKQSATQPVTRELGKDLVAMSTSFAKATNTETAVGGNGGAFGDFTTEAGAKIWPVVIAEAVVLFILIASLLRAVVLPAVAVAFDLLTAGATFGSLSLLYSGDNPILSGGPGYIDPISIIGIFAFIFGVSMVYEIVLLYRTREAFLATGDAHGAIRTGLGKTAAVATGAAAVMVAAIIPFALVDLLSVQVFGVGVAIAILIDALIVRPVLLPAAVEVLGRWSWWPLSRQAPPTPARARKMPTAPPAPRVPTGGVPVGG
jgi:RND superfamily putative drug exporter